MCVLCNIVKWSDLHQWWDQRFPDRTETFLEPDVVGTSRAVNLLLQILYLDELTGCLLFNMSHLWEGPTVTKNEYYPLHFPVALMFCPISAYHML